REAYAGAIAMLGRLGVEADGDNAVQSARIAPRYSGRTSRGWEPLRRSANVLQARRKGSVTGGFAYPMDLPQGGGPVPNRPLSSHGARFGCAPNRIGSVAQMNLIFIALGFFLIGCVHSQKLPVHVPAGDLPGIERALLSRNPPVGEPEISLAN